MRLGSALLSDLTYPRVVFPPPWQEAYCWAVRPEQNHFWFFIELFMYFQEPCLYHHGHSLSSFQQDHFWSAITSQVSSEDRLRCSLFIGHSLCLVGRHLQASSLLCNSWTAKKYVRLSQSHSLTMDNFTVWVPLVRLAIAVLKPVP